MMDATLNIASKTDEKHFPTKNFPDLYSLDVMSTCFKSKQGCKLAFVPDTEEMQVLSQGVLGNFLVLSGM